jgi:hypothetical protein
MGSIDVHAKCISCSYNYAFFILVSLPHLKVLKNIHMTSCEFNTLVDSHNIPFAPFTTTSCVA